MKVLITGANGFLGRATVQAFFERGHAVRAMVRPASGARFADRAIEIVHADLRATAVADLAAAFDGVDVLVHLAATVIGSDAMHYSSTVGGTERLLEAMAASRTRRLILASSMSVYDWARTRGTMSERSPLEDRPYARGAYATAKLWQERVAVRLSRAHGWQLTILRPGVIWAPDHDVSYFLGPTVGRFQVVVGPFRRLPLTEVTSCAAAFVAAAVSDQTASREFNVVDGDDSRAWTFAGDAIRASGARRVRIPLPYWGLAATARLASWCSRAFFGRHGKLPSLLMPRRVAVFKPLRFSNRAATTDLGWRPLPPGHGGTEKIQPQRHKDTEKICT